MALAMQRYETNAQFKCPACENDVAMSVELPEPDYGADRTSDMAVFGDSYVSCPHCDTEFHLNAWSGPHECSLEFEDHPNRKIRTGPPSYSAPDDWEDYDPPENPYTIFMDSDAQLMNLLERHGGAADGTNLINRMVFAQYIGALEAFLADTLLNVVENDKDAFANLLAQDEELKKQKFGLAEIVKSPDLVKSKVRTHIRDVRWHNLARADVLYKIAMKFDLLAVLGEKKELLFQAVQLRHDCVHRNGFDVQGNRLDTFTKEYVASVAAIVRFLVGSVHGHIEFGDADEPF